MRIKKISRVCFFLIFLMSWAFWGFADENAPTWVGSETCKECHESSFTDFSLARHGVTKDPKTPASGMGCESCHGPGSIHAESEDPAAIIGLSPKAPGDANKKNNMCISCHFKGKTALWSGSSHESRGLACTDCHQVHNNKNEKLLIANEASTCGNCHKRVRSELLRQSHHPIREEKMTCTDCHNAHGAIADKLVDAQTVNMKCYECHAEKRGPFLWEHMPVTEDCMTCHFPHGASRSPLLKAKMPFLCQRCHSNSGHAGELSGKMAGQEGLTAYQASRNRLLYRSCINCHSQVHGSNHPSGKKLLR